MYGVLWQLLVGPTPATCSLPAIARPSTDSVSAAADAAGPGEPHGPGGNPPRTEPCRTHRDQLLAAGTGNPDAKATAIAAAYGLHSRRITLNTITVRPQRRVLQPRVRLPSRRP